MIKLQPCVVAQWCYKQVCGEAWSEQEAPESLLRYDFVRRGSEKSSRFDWRDNL